MEFHVCLKCDSRFNPNDSSAYMNPSDFCCISCERSYLSQQRSESCEGCKASDINLCPNHAMGNY